MPVMLKNNLGYPRVGIQRQLKKACEQYWGGKITQKELFNVANIVEEDGWKAQCDAEIDLIPVGDFSLYDHVLDMAFLFSAIPERFSSLVKKLSSCREKSVSITGIDKNSLNNHKKAMSSESGDNFSEVDLYFAMARGYQKEGLDITPLEMTKWFDTNYHYLVPEFTASQQFKVFSNRLFSRFSRAKTLIKNGIPKPVLIGPISFLLLGKEKQTDFHRLDLLDKLLPVYIEVLLKFAELGAEWIQLDEPFLALDLTDREKKLYEKAYTAIHSHVPSLKILLASYFGGIDHNAPVALALPVSALHLDLLRSPEQLDTILNLLATNRDASKLGISLGLVDGRNVWKNDYKRSIEMIRRTTSALEGTTTSSRVVLISPSCSLLHVPFDLDFENEIHPDMKNWMSFAKQKLQEIHDLYEIANGNDVPLRENHEAISSRSRSSSVHNPAVKDRINAITPEDCQRASKFTDRQKVQREHFKLPPFATTTIGSFPQTSEIRQLRLKLRKGEITQEQYETAIEKAIIDVIKFQEEIGLDVLVHGEFERNDMVEYFGELLEGFVFTKNGWVTSYGSRCVKPPIIFGDVNRISNMTVRWSAFAQSQTTKLMKGMLTGPVTILQWSFVRDDQPRSLTALQIALAIRDEVVALEQAGLKVVQIDEPAIREGLPLRHKDWQDYLNWAVKAFLLSSCGVKDETQVHTHMCYSEFNDIIEHIAKMDADVITVENSRSQMDLLRAFSNFKYPNEIGPGVYDIHSPRIPSSDEMFALLQQAARILPSTNLWVNPDCGLKTRSWNEVKQSLLHMIEAARRARKQLVN